MFRPLFLPILAILILCGAAVSPAHAQAQVQPRQDVREVMGSLDYGLHPAVMVAAGVLSGVVAASVIGGGFTVAASLVEGVSLIESLEAGTGLTLPAIAASGTLGGLMGYFLSGQ